MTRVSPGFIINSTDKARGWNGKRARYVQLFLSSDGSNSIALNGRSVRMHPSQLIVTSAATRIICLFGGDELPCHLLQLADTVTGVEFTTREPFYSGRNQDKSPDYSFRPSDQYMDDLTCSNMI